MMFGPIFENQIRIVQILKTGSDLNSKTGSGSDHIFKTGSGSDQILKTKSGSDLTKKTVSVLFLKTGSDLILKPDPDSTKAPGPATLAGGHSGERDQTLSEIFV